MGLTTDDIFVKTFVTDANFPFLGLADLFGPHGTAFRILAEAVQRGLGGLWVDGHASARNGTLQFSGNRSNVLVFGHRVFYSIELTGTQVSVQKNIIGGLFPSSRLILVRHHGEEVKIATPNGHGDILGAAVKSWV